jgi:hypothetical protein
LLFWSPDKAVFQMCGNLNLQFIKHGTALHIYSIWKTGRAEEPAALNYIVPSERPTQEPTSRPERVNRYLQESFYSPKVVLKYHIFHTSKPQDGIDILTHDWCMPQNGGEFFSLHIKHGQHLKIQRRLQKRALRRTRGYRINLARQVRDSPNCHCSHCSTNPLDRPPFVQRKLQHGDCQR